VEPETPSRDVAVTAAACGLGLEIVDGRPQVRSVSPGSSAEKFHVAKGWILGLVNGQPAAGLTLAQLRQRILDTQGQPFAVIDFVLPDGTTQRVLLPVRD
jgi:C-terminal processing protease CtpA/Prc